MANTRQEQITKQETLGTVAWGVANEFNNMLTTILCNTGLALMELPQDHPVWNYVEVIEKVTDRAAALVNRLVTASGRGECAMAHVDLPELLHGMMPEIQEKIPSGVEFRPSVTPGPPPIKADAGLLRQLIMSLVQNAADVMSDRIGSIAVATGTEDCTGEDLSAMALGDDPRPGAYTYVEVSDTGGGIAPDIEKQMFDPFFSTKPMAHGLGLAVVAGVTRQHKGAVLVRTNSRGTTVRLLFPVARQVVAPVAPPASEPEPAQWRVDILQWRGHGTVLVIDDEANLCQAVERVLQLFGFDVLTAGGGEQGIDLFHEHMDDVVLVLLDQVMPVMGGEQVFDALKAIRPSLPIILSTGYAEEDVMDIVSAKGFSGFIQKPYEPTKLVERVRSVLEG